MKYFNIAVCAGAVALFSAACSSNDDPAPAPGQNDKFPVVEMDTIRNPQFTAAQEGVNASLNDFGFNLLNTAISVARDKDENVTVSPLSATMALSMALNSGDSDFESALLRMFGASDADDLNATVNKLMRYLVSRDNGSELLLANSAWVNKALTPSEAWSSMLTFNFYSSIYPTDFTAAGVNDDINAWCSSNTRGLIPSVKVKVDATTQLVLINALYYGADWALQFDPAKTKRENFVGTKGKSECEMMHNVVVTPYYRGENYRIVSMHMGVNEMQFVLPDEGVAPSAVAAALSQDVLEGAGNTKARVTLSLPKFGVKGYASPDVFASLGVPAGTVLDKLGLSERADIKVFQDSYTTIDEKGAKAAAVTVVSTDTSIGPGEPEYEDVTVTFDRPFLFFIRNRLTGTVIMSGVINNID